MMNLPGFMGWLLLWRYFMDIIMGIGAVIQGNLAEGIILQIKARAKINLVLDILGLRSDGYHQLASVMQTLDWHDELFLSPAPQIKLQIRGADLSAGPDNLVWQAAQLLREKTGCAAGANITLIKNIPLAAGLGGGSADAAAVLVGLNKLWGLGLSYQQLSTLGAAIGSDVPFCLRGGTALATGRGEIIKPLPDLPNLGVVLVRPHINVSTAQVYQLYRRRQQSHRHKQTPGCGAMLKAIDQGRVDQVPQLLSNHLECITTSMHPVISTIKEHLAATDALGVLMSGSGPTVFALYSHQSLAQKAVHQWPRGDFSVHVTELAPASVAGQ